MSVRLSGVLADRAGAARLAVTVAAGATVADLLAALRSAHPELAPALGTTLVVVGGEAVGPATPLSAGQEVALVMPAAGGARERRSCPWRWRSDPERRPCS